MIKHEDFITRKGKVYTSVTKSLELINDEKLNKARGFLGNREYEQRQEIGRVNGNSFHELSAVIDEGRGIDINYDKVEEIVRENLYGFQEWSLENVVKVIVIEKRFFSDTYLDQGIPDRVYLLKGRKSPDLIDFKTGKVLNMKKIRYQLSRYKELLKEHKIETNRRIVLHIRDGVVKPIYLDPSTHISDHKTYLYIKAAYMDYISK